jgi:hypothetical protein
LILAVYAWMGAIVYRMIVKVSKKDKKGLTANLRQWDVILGPIITGSGMLFQRTKWRSDGIRNPRLSEYELVKENSRTDGR